MPNELPLSGLEQPVRNEIIAVGTASQVIAEYRNVENPRKMILVRNTSDDPTKIITVHLGPEVAVANAGIVLQQNESFSDSSENVYLAHQGTITAISAVAASQLSITER